MVCRRAKDTRCAGPGGTAARRKRSPAVSPKGLGYTPPMFRLARVLLIWLLAFALPAQGVMAATMIFCGPAHHDRAAASSAVHDADAAHELQGPAAHSHAAAADAQAEQTATDAESTAPHQFAKSKMQKCSVCASCCSAAALHDTVAKLPVVEPVATAFAALAPTVEPFAADGPDRPPRHLLA